MRQVSFRMIEAGALAILTTTSKYRPPRYKRRGTTADPDTQTMSEVKLVKRTSRALQHTRDSENAVDRVLSSGIGFQIVAFGASTGGPKCLQTILSDYYRKTFHSIVYCSAHLQRVSRADSLNGCRIQPISLYILLLMVNTRWGTRVCRSG